MCSGSEQAGSSAGRHNGFLLEEALFSLLVLILACHLLLAAAQAFLIHSREPVHPEIRTEWFYHD